MTKEKPIDFSHLWLALIAGGDGTRLWPISNMNCPKQFCQLPTGETFCQATVERFMRLGVKPNHIMVITTNDHQRALAIEQLTPLKVISPNKAEAISNLLCLAVHRNDAGIRGAAALAAMNL